MSLQIRAAHAILVFKVRLLYVIVTVDMLTGLVFDESNFVTCTVCDDYDLCIPCHVSLKHGHHPGHAFVPASEETSLDIMASNLCTPGRSIRHFAICDGCDKVYLSVLMVLYLLTHPEHPWCTSQVHELP